uniref:PUB domain-containing protein n=1 Tax=Aplanochytrium stocchinoi TaxID=215587 RepID=A0A7S3V131_9STRA|mmetsp:Transcript_10523/g.13190  ORF Transcript_10523/g.13190 Transcript_10523/m.13190 type:complete len:134 (-) Transcript_10523:871-1272(-)|eukprot:CAMPEP_0204830376 /NCGR_PEP_ID=MMETSP1346-20131115/8502_1 /ASSEMBLY_ACC=CAM_ASM_000771 /TAXON_ID=215587 /ORGANISM="Aplanochytrium stocchinoi, Strain GSBS06" /LENGTH=133 /DNA_ID=CAMNT_0051960569 /DNA_START=225 /DNA_END=626 /DNA_ORIENTATION=+
MGYSVGYSTTNAASKLELTPIEKILRKISNKKSLEILSKICRNISQSPKEEKYRKLRLDNKTIKENLVNVYGCLDFLTEEEVGFVEEEIITDGGDRDIFLILPLEKKINFTMVQKIEKAIDFREKEDQRIRKK